MTAKGRGERADDGALLVRVGDRLCALPLREVGEVFRPLPVRPLADAPFGVVGVAVVGGKASPVVDLAPALVARRRPIRRFVALKLGERTLVLAVSEIVATTRLRDVAAEAPSPLVSALSPDAVTALGRLDDELLTVLSSAHLVREDLWDALPAEEDARGH